MTKAKKHGTTTITLSIPIDMKGFFDDLADNGYNRSFFMLKMAKILSELYRNRDKYPGGLHQSVENLLKRARSGELMIDRIDVQK